MAGVLRGAGLEVIEGVAEGAALASSDEIRITIRAQGTHGSAPHTGQDAILAAAHFLGLCQQLITRKTDSRDSAVLSFGQIAGGLDPNILSDAVRIGGSLRSHSKKGAGRSARPSEGGRGSVLGFVPLPLPLVAALGALLLCYLASSDLTKMLTAAK